MIRVEVGDITMLRSEAIVNAANSTLLGGGGVDGAIHRAAGPQLLAECKSIKGCPTGQACMTLAYDLPAQYVIHTVGPIWHGGGRNEARLLASCYEASLKLCLDNGIQRVVFPAISCGIYGYPREQAVDIAVCTVLDLYQRCGLVEVVFCCFDESMASLYRQRLSR
ncbi:O-acetyl-ADP-ribose deacetylase [Amphritea japonica]|uniref:Appr-1-p processing domain protein n=1 Tax=Amphritea japonica ATCC BAA-1530 TaxID=1278309 RepID=A0A7R6P3K2_9GAMM|nr:O-acetyl-ADP-ribose deacetylase [Amphritea japonica]BBB26374.1 Appr-1-p processing domain protein [Amphritea japonica ATCC BAA-1530]